MNRLRHRHLIAVLGAAIMVAGPTLGYAQGYYDRGDSWRPADSYGEDPCHAARAEAGEHGAVTGGMLGALAGAACNLTGRAPNIDFALVALRRGLGLPEGAAFNLFALGRSLGWIAHALEQRETGQLIRPRAVYRGPEPVTGAP